MKTKIISIALALTATLLAMSFRSSEPFIELLKSKLKTFNQTYQEEKVYVQFDKSLYKPGDIIWLNVFVLNAGSLKPSEVSDVVYVELIDPRGTVAKKLELFIDEGTSHGDFELEKTAPGGLYKVRAYTLWMQNFGSESHFSKDVPVQGLITPRLLLTLDFEKKAYGSSETVIANLKAKDLKNAWAIGADGSSELKLNGKTVQTKIIQIEANGEAKLAFKLPDTLTTNDGLIQALVRFNGVEESISRSVPIVLNKIELKFYPEGGELLAGHHQRVAFKATNEFGKGADVRGEIVDEANVQVAAFESFHFGMGSLSMLAQSNKKYFARITNPFQSKELIALPIAKEGGHGLAVEHVTDTSVLVSIFSDEPASVFLVGRVRDEIQYAQKLSLQSGESEILIPVQTMPAGVLTFTLFNADGIEQAERLAYIHYNRNLHINITTNKKEYEPGERVEATIKTFDAFGKPIPTRMALSVVDNQLLTTVDDKQDNLLTWMLLGSDIRGKIDDPSFYFNPDELKAKEALDYLLMVHGWRRFTWQEVRGAGKSITYLPENMSTLTGLVADKANLPTQAEVTLMELNNRRRMAKVLPTKNGQFVFKNIDASAQILLLVKAPNTLEVNGRKTYTNNANFWYRVDGASRDMRVPLNAFGPDAEPAGTVEVKEDGEMDLAMGADVAQLSEVVVTGYGISREKKALGYSVVSIDYGVLQAQLANPSINNLLSGRMPGVSVIQGAPGSGSPIMIRGFNSLSNNNQPLYVIDGVPMADFNNKNFQGTGLVSPENIESVHVLKSPEATALFGSAAAHGVILIETKGRVSNAFISVPRKPRYTVMPIEPRQFSPVREFYQEKQSPTDTRKNFNPTVFWQHTVVTDSKGETKISFLNSGATSSFRMTAEGISASGSIGRKEITYFTQLPFLVDVKIPERLGFEDTVRLPVRIVNNTDKKQQVTLTLNIPKGFVPINGLIHTVEVDANQSKIVPVVLSPDAMTGSFPIAIKVENNRYSDEIKQTIQVTPIGFPVRFSYSGRDMKKTFHVDIRDVEQGSIKGEVVVITNLLDDVLTSVESMLREPHGCFEQVSSSTFPNILVLQLLKESGRDNPAIRQKALNYIDQGYKKLIGYEVKGGGFEWFGKPPAHTALTGYGLLEFTEMNKVYQYVDEAMMKRTTAWLLNKRKGDGTFKTSNEGYDGFSSAPANVTNAYLVYVFSETGIGGIDKEYALAFQEGLNSKDLYRSALLANAALNQNKISDYEQLKASFMKALATDGIANVKAESTITRSYGQSLQTETLALWALALIKEKSPDLSQIKALIEHIGSKKSFGTYGSTQATCLSLKAITEYVRLVKQSLSGGSLQIAFEANPTDEIQYTGNERENLTSKKFSSSLREGVNPITIQFQNTQEALPYSLNVQWNTKTPQSNTESKVSIETFLSKPTIKVNQTVRLKAALINKTQEHLPMGMAVIGIPAGLSLQPWQLKELLDKNAVDFYEIRANSLVLYYRTMKPSERKEVNLDLKADIPGNYQAGASCAYLYYADEFKTWIKGERVKIE